MTSKSMSNVWLITLRGNGGLMKYFYHEFKISFILFYFMRSKESNTRCCCSLMKLRVVNPRHISPSCCVCILQPGPCDRRIQISKMPFGRGLVHAALRMPLHPFGTLFLHLLNVPLSLIPSRAAWRPTYLMWHIPRSTDSYIVWVYCLWLF